MDDKDFERITQFLKDIKAIHLDAEISSVSSAKGIKAMKEVQENIIDFIEEFNIFHPHSNAPSKLPPYNGSRYC